MIRDASALMLAGLAAIVLVCGCEMPSQRQPQVTVAGTTFPDTTGEQHWLSFRDQLAAMTGDKLPLNLLIYGQLGSEDQLVSGLRRGRVQFANLSAMAVSTVVPEMALLYAPFLFDNPAEADFVYDHYLTPVYRELLAAKGLHLVSWYEIGFVQVYGKEPLLTPADAVGRRFRVGAGPAARLFAKAVGADVIPLGFADVVPALQTGLVAAGENAVSLYARTGIAAEAPHLSLTNHGFGVSAIVASKPWFDSLTLQQQAAVMQAWPSAEATRAAVRAESAADLEAGAALGITVHSLTAEQRAAWRTATAGVTEQLIATIGGQSRDIHALVQTARREYAKSAQAQPTLTEAR